LAPIAQGSTRDGKGFVYFFAAHFICVIVHAVIAQAERELWAAVVIRALDDLAETGKEAPRLRQAARACLISHRTRVGSFIWICCSLNQTRGLLGSPCTE
jgi:hypothetical protein